MLDIKVGDIVECVDDTNCMYICKGQKYLVVPNAGWITKESSYITVEIMLDGRKHSQEYNKERFKLAKKQFDMFNEAWVIAYNDQQEFELVREFVKSKGFKFAFGEECVPLVGYVTNRGYNGGVVIPGQNNGVMRVKNNYNRKEIKFNFKTTKRIESVIYPEVKTEKEIEIDRIKAEINKLTDRLEQLQGE